MSEYTFKLPDLGEGTVEAEIAEWMVKVGDVVAEEDPICAMLTDKAAVELSAPVAGKVLSVAGQEGDMVSVGAPLIVFQTDSAAAANAAENVSAETPAPQPIDEQPAEKQATDEQVAKKKPAPADKPSVAAPARPGKVMTSPSIRARAREAGIDLTEVPGTGPRGRILKTDFEG
ncbi:MAG: biotin/lipoyl-containing protein, partial [Lysobacterales bacterium]